MPPQVDPGGGVEAGARLVHQQQARAVQQPLASSTRRRMPPLNVADALVRAVGQAERGQRARPLAAAKRLPRRPYRWPWWRRFSRGGELLVEAGRLEDDADVAGGPASRSAASVDGRRCERDRRAAAMSVERMRKRVVLPLPLGPRRPKISPRVDRQARGRRAPARSP